MMLVQHLIATSNQESQVTSWSKKVNDFIHHFGREDVLFSNCLETLVDPKGTSRHEAIAVFRQKLSMKTAYVSAL